MVSRVKCQCLFAPGILVLACWLAMSTANARSKLVSDEAFAARVPDSGDGFEEDNRRRRAADLPRTRSSSLVLERLFDEQIPADNVAELRQRSTTLPDMEQFEFLMDCVLPSETHSDIRLSGTFTQTDPAPIAALPAGEMNAGAELVSPVFDLFDVAKKTGRLPELRSRIENLPPRKNEFQQRARAAMLALVNLELQDQDAAEAAISELHSLVKDTKPGGVREQWPEMLVVYRGVHCFGRSVAVRDLLNVLYEQRTLRSSEPAQAFWHTHIVALDGLSRHLLDGGSQAAFETKVPPADWIPAIRAQAISRGSGCAHGRWHRKEPYQQKHVSGHQSDFLYYRLPLRGSFTMEGEIGGQGTTQLCLAGSMLGPVGGGKLAAGSFGQNAPVVVIDPPLAPSEEWIAFRAVFRGNNCRLFLNGRLVSEESLPQHHDPWIGFRSWWRSGARIRNVRITGKPKVPEAVVMSASKVLNGWLSYHDSAAWQHVDDAESTGQIIGPCRAADNGVFQEALLRYHRPLTDHGSVEYDFYYEPGIAHTHPALDRLVLMLHPHGVRVHWITDGGYDRTLVRPDNEFEEPENRRGPEQLPLKAGAWNHVRLAVASDVAALELNGRVVYERNLEPGNSRAFGLFHYVDQTQIRARNCVMRGDWPKRLPPVSDQELADPLIDTINQRLPELASTFEHDFVAGGVPTTYFKSTVPALGEMRPEKNGLATQLTASGGWVGLDLVARFEVHGDFDVEATFDNLNLTGEKNASVMIEANLMDERRQGLQVMRMKDQQPRHAIGASFSELRKGQRDYESVGFFACDSLSGRLRMVRRGNTVYYLYSEEDSPEFRIVGERTVSGAPTSVDGVKLKNICNGTSSSSVVWKGVRITAEKLIYHPAEVPRSLHLVTFSNNETMKDGVVQHVTNPIDGMTYLGRPDWSADGTKLVCDMSQGSGDTARIVMLNADGTDMEDLGPGYMPSLSIDGKQLVYGYRAGIFRMNIDGTDRQQLAARGWGPKWSPDGAQIAWGSANNITLLSTETDARRELLTVEQQQQINGIHSSLGWSQNSRSVAFRSRDPATANELVVVADVDSPAGFKVVYSRPTGVNDYFTWHPDGRRIMFSLNDGSGMRLVTVNRDTDDGPQPVSGIPADWQTFDCDWSPDGRQVVFSARAIAAPVEWLAN